MRNYKISLSILQNGGLPELLVGPTKVKDGLKEIEGNLWKGKCKDPGPKFFNTSCLVIEKEVFINNNGL